MKQGVIGANNQALIHGTFYIVASTLMPWKIAKRQVHLQALIKRGRWVKIFYQLLNSIYLNSTLLKTRPVGLHFIHSLNHKKFMRKFFFPAFAALFSLYSCNDGVKVAGETKDNSMAEKNMQASRTVAKAFETGDVSGIDSVVATDFVDHTDRGDKVGRDSLKAMITMMHANFKDMKMKTKKEFAD